MVDLMPLAFVSDLLSRNIDATDQILADTMLASASAAIREAAGSVISRTTSTFSLVGSQEPWLPVPLQPIRSVDTVKIDGAAIVDFKVRDGRLWRSAGWASTAEGSEVELTVTHGFDVVPEDIVDLCCSLAAAGIIAATEDGYDPKRGLASFGIDDYREGYAKGDDEIISPFDLPQRTRDWLRQRFGGGAYVIGTY